MRSRGGLQPATQSPSGQFGIGAISTPGGPAADDLLHNSGHAGRSIAERWEVIDGRRRFKKFERFGSAENIAGMVGKTQESSGIR